MVLVTAVRTTGIYCHSGCSARPLAKNTETYPSQLAAEVAGFRACLRCRPERQASLELDASAPPALRRAVEAINAGALDGGTESSLAAAVGYSERHLRRLFVDHLGATPGEMARSRRAHFARRLLDETDLTVTEIAYAAGFNSPRQMHRVVSSAFGFAPADLRRRRRRVPDSIDGGLRLSLPAPGLGWNDVLTHLAPRLTPGVESISGSTYARTFTLCGHVGVVELTQVVDDNVEALVHLPDFGGVIEVVHRVRRLIGLDMPAAVDIEQLRSDELLGRLVEDAAQLRVPGAWDRFETLVRIVIGQQVSVKGASTMTGRLVVAATAPVEGLSRLQLTHRFPTAAEIVDADLGNCGFTGSRLRTIHALAEAVAGGEVDVDSPPDELRRQLQEVHGIGPWTVEVAAVRVARDPDAFAASDLGLRDAVGALLGTGRADASTVEDVSQRWRPHRSLAAAVLWSGGSVANEARQSLSE